MHGAGTGIGGEPKLNEFLGMQETAAGTVLCNTHTLREKRGPEEAVFTEHRAEAPGSCIWFCFLPGLVGLRLLPNGQTQ